MNIDKYLLPYIFDESIKCYYRPALINLRPGAQHFIYTCRSKKYFYHTMSEYRFTNITNAKQSLDKYFVKLDYILLQDHEIEKYKKLLLLI